MASPKRARRCRILSVKGSRLSFPLTWGGDKRAAVELDKGFARVLVSRIEAGASVSRRRNPFFEEDDTRQRVWVRGEREVTTLRPGLRASATAGWQHVAFLEGPGSNAGMLQAGADVVLDTRLDPMLARNAVYARAAWDHLTTFQGTAGGAVNQPTPRRARIRRSRRTERAGRSGIARRRR